MADDEDSIWDYKPIKRGRVPTASKDSKSSIIAQKEKAKAGPSVNSRLPMQMKDMVDDNESVNKMNKDLIMKCAKKLNSRGDNNSEIAFCPFCQMPFCILRSDSPRAHVLECMDLPLNATIECEAGLKCDDTIASHYRKFKHTKLANIRSGCIEKEDFEKAQSDHNEDDYGQSNVDDARRKLNFSSSKKICENGVTGNSSLLGPKCSVAVSRCLDNNHDPVSVSNTSVDQAKKKLTFSVKKSEISSQNTKPTDPETSNDRTASLDDNNICKNQSEYRNGRKRKLPTSQFSQDAPSCSDFTQIKSTFKNCTTNINRQDSPPSMAVTQDVHYHSNVVATHAVVQDTNDQQLQNGDIKNDVKVIESNNTAASGNTSDNDIFGDDSSDEEFFRDVSDMITNDDIVNNSDHHQGKKLLLKASKSECDIQVMENNHMSKQQGLTRSSTFMPGPQKLTRNTLRTPAKQKAASQLTISSFFKPKSVSNKQSVANTTSTNTVQNKVQSFDKPCTSTGSTLSVSQNNAPSTSKDGNVAKLTRSNTVSTMETLTEEKETMKKPWNLRQAKSSKTGTGSSNAVNFGFDDLNGDTESTSFNKPGFQRKCPFYKKMPGTPFTVDAFRYGIIPGCSAYFLTHFHYDHYGGLRKSFNQPIYCSKETANLVEKKIKVDRRYLHTIALNTPTLVHNVEITFMDANHCPGSVIILYKLRDGRVYLHTGDFRATTDMQSYPELRGVKVNQLYLDTTYCDPQYAFPPQNDVIRFAVQTTNDFLHENPNALIVVGSYTIGKERIFMAIAEELNCKVCVTREKKHVLDCLEDDVINRHVTLEMMSARVHVVQMKSLNHQALTSYLDKLKPRFDCVLAFEPTGWTHSSKVPSVDNIKPKWRRDKVTLYGIPYSEHSSYTELKEFCQFIKADKILPTVNNGNAQSRRKMEALFESWMKESPSKQLKQQKLGSFFSQTK